MKNTDNLAIACVVLIILGLGGYLINSSISSLGPSSNELRRVADTLCREKGGIGTSLKLGHDSYYKCYDSNEKVVAKIDFNFVQVLARNINE